MNATKQPTQIAEFNNAWRGRGTLDKLATELERQKNSRIDFVGDARQMQMKPATEPGRIRLEAFDDCRASLGGDPLEVTPVAFEQLCTMTKPSIPTGFGKELAANRAGDLAYLYNSLVGQSPARRFYRLLDGKVRACLSERYRVIDNGDLMFAALEGAHVNKAEVIEASLSDTSMRIKFVNRTIWDAIDVVQRGGNQGTWYAAGMGSREFLGRTVLGATLRNELPGGPGTIYPVLTLSNSEVGKGGARLRLGILQGICYNVATLEDVVSEIHLGGTMGEGVYRPETLTVEMQAVVMKVQDAIKAAFTPASFKRLADKVKDAVARPIERPVAAVEQIVQLHDWTIERKEAILQRFLGEYIPLIGQNDYALAQSVSRVAQDVESAEEAAELEDAAGALMLTPAEAVK